MGVTDQGREASGSVKEVFISMLWTMPGTQKIMSTGKLVSKGKMEEPWELSGPGKEAHRENLGYPRVVWQEGM